LLAAEELLAYDISQAACDNFTKSSGVECCCDAAAGVMDAECILIAVKPQMINEALAPLAGKLDGKLIISIAAGVTIEALSSITGTGRIIRVMPNTPMLICQGVSALCRTENVSDEDFLFACNIFASAGKIIKITEDEMNKIICVTGSSPAYIFMVIKAMRDAAESQGLLESENNLSGLDEKELLDAICDTIIGSAMLVKASDKSLAEQIQTVCSKGGTTEQAVAELEKYKLYEAFDSAMQKCTNRAYELGNAKK
jgi:pyrroline-5-carboxylate reductase